jgi:hypothetical protein
MTDSQGIGGGKLAVAPASDSTTKEPIGYEVAAAGIDAFAEFEHQYLREYVGLADQKAGIAVAVYAALLTFLVDHIPSNFMDADAPWTVALTLAALVLLLAAAILALLVVIPRLGSDGRSIIYFGDVSQRTNSKDYLREVTSKANGQINAAIIEHCHVLAGICSKKYRMLRKSIVCGSFGFLFLTISIYWLQAIKVTAAPAP